MSNQPPPTPASVAPPTPSTSTETSLDDTGEIRAPKGEATMVILAAIEDLRSDVDARFTTVDSRLTNIERTQGGQGSTLQTLTNQVADHTIQLGKLADAQISTARAASSAAEMAAQALARSNTAQDDNRKMVEGAMAIQRGAIASAVAEAVKPMKADIDRQNEALGAVVNELGLEGQVALGREVKPGEPAPRRPLVTLEQRAKNSQLVQLVIAIGTIATALYQLLH